MENCLKNCGDVMTMILCEQCGNEFDYGKKVERENKTYISCPYCRYLNQPPQRRKKRPFNKQQVKQNKK